MATRITPEGSSSHYTSENSEKQFYQLPLSSDDKKNIDEVIKRTGEEWLVQLLLEKNELEALGEKIKPIHPLRFLGYIFSHPTLPFFMQGIKNKFFVWGKFIRNLTTRFQEENYLQYISGFCKEVNQDQKRISEFLVCNNIEGLVSYLIDQKINP